MTTIDDPKLVLKELLVDEWNAANVYDVTPKRNTGWRDSDLAGPQVTVSGDEESPLNPTGFSGIEPDGSGPTATTRGTVALNTWTTRPLTEATATGMDNPKGLSKALSSECKRIVRANLDPGQHAFNVGGLTAEHYRYISWLGREFLPEEPDADEDPIVYRYRCEVRYEYLDRP